MLTYEATLLGVKELEPSGNYTDATLLVTLVGEDGDPLGLVASPEAFAVCAEAERLSRLRVRLALRTYRTRERGRVHKLRVLTAEVLAA